MQRKSSGMAPQQRGTTASSQHSRGSTGLPDVATRHVLSRFSGGVSGPRLAEVSAAGGVGGWFESQLSPGSIPDHQADVLKGWFTTLASSPAQRWSDYIAGTVTPSKVAGDLASWITLRRLISKRAVLETMVDFWSNLLHVPSPSANLWVWRDEYEEMVRAHALGRYADLLEAAILHPCMGMYLNAHGSSARDMNENLGRELLECHTVGIDTYTESDVLNSARILTGFEIDRGRTWAQSYLPSNHWIGRVTVLGFSSSNAKADGRPVLKKYLSYLAHHPLTAARVCRRLAIRFVSDDPSPELVDSLAQVYLDSDTAISPVLKAMVASTEFQASALFKTRTSVEDVVATWTALDVVVAAPQSPFDAANQLVPLGRGVGQVVYDWATPDGFPDTQMRWIGAGRLLASMAVHWMGASASYPSRGITYRTPMQWMPQLPTTFDHVVEHVVASTLFLPTSSTMLQAACIATGCRPTDVIDEQHPVAADAFPRLLVSILDTPEHLSR